MEIRLATEKDAPEIQKIYAPYVTETAITFEYDVPDTQEFERRIRHTLEDYPYLVALEQGRIIGYAYAGAFRPRSAYQHSAEVSIYLEKTRMRKGVGTRLYREMEKLLRRQNVLVLYACITETERKTDPFLTDISIRFHESMGYTLTGRFFHCGYKFDRWYNMIWMEKRIGDLEGTPDPFVPFSRTDQ